MTTETEYIKITNRVKVSCALWLLRDVMGVEEYGISEDELREILCALSNAEDRLFGSVEVDVI